MPERGRQTSNEPLHYTLYYTNEPADEPLCRREDDRLLMSLFTTLFTTLMSLLTSLYAGERTTDF